MRAPDDSRVISIWGIRSGSLGAYSFAFLCVSLAALAHGGLELFVSDNQVFTTFYPAVLFAALIGGLGAGIFATLLSGLIVWGAFMAPNYALGPRSFGEEVSLGFYLLACALMVWGADHYRKGGQKLRAEEHFRRLAVEELAHRLKNKIATIQSVIAYHLRDNPETRDAITGRLVALSATDDLIIAAQGRGAQLRDILSIELDPYEISRIAIEGPPVVLPEKLAIMTAMVIHELATNAAKYGALSSQSGKVSIRWSLFDACLRLEWRESGGPPVGMPSRRGFGTRLLSGAMDQFGGIVETNFELTGLVCKLSAMLRE